MMGGPWGWGMGLSSILFLALLVIGVVLLVRPPSRGESGRDDDAARRILDERFARGEIEEEEYEHRRKILETTRR